MALKGKPIAVGTSDTDIYLVPATLEASVHGLVFYNTTTNSVTLTVKIYTQSTAVTTTLLNAVTVSSKGTYVWDKPINLGAADKIIASAGTGSALVANYSVFENSATPASTGFTGRGTWSSSANYVANDVVSASNGNSYLAIQASSNQDPTTATQYWQVLASKGDTGAVSSITAGTGLTGGTLNSASSSGTFNIDTSTVATLSNTQTLTNKTLEGVTLTNAFIEELTQANSGASYTVAYSDGSVQELTLTANCTITMPTGADGRSLTLILKQDSSGSRTVTWSSVNWSGATAPTLTTTANYKDIFQFLAIGTTWYGWVVSQNHA